MSAMTLGVEPQVEEWAAIDTDPEVGYTKLRCLLVAVLNRKFCVATTLALQSILPVGIEYKEYLMQL